MFNDRELSGKNKSKTIFIHVGILDILNLKYSKRRDKNLDKRKLHFNEKALWRKRDWV